MSYHLKHISYRDGYCAYVRGDDKNPFFKNSEDWHLWNAGHSAAEFNTRPK